MNDVKKKILNVAKTLDVAATVARVVVIVLMVVTALQIVAAFSLKTPLFTGFFDGTINDIDSVLGRSAIFEGLFEFAGLRAMEPVYQKAIELFITFLSLLVMLLYLGFFKRIIAHIVTAGQPFSRHTALQIKKGSYALLLLVLVNPVLGLLTFLLLRFFSPSLGAALGLSCPPSAFFAFSAGAS